MKELIKKKVIAWLLRCFPLLQVWNAVFQLLCSTPPKITNQVMNFTPPLFFHYLRFVSNWLQSKMYKSKESNHSRGLLFLYTYLGPVNVIPCNPNVVPVLSLCNPLRSNDYAGELRQKVNPVGRPISPTSYFELTYRYRALLNKIAPS